MALDTAWWSLNDDPARVVDLRQPDSLNYLLDHYGERRQEVLAEVLGQAYAAGAQTAVVEFRYIDADYRDEHSRFYSTTFRRYPSTALAKAIDLWEDLLLTLARVEARPRDDVLHIESEVQPGYLGWIGYNQAGTLTFQLATKEAADE